MGSAVRWSLCPCDGVNDMARQGASSDHYCGARRRRLGDTTATQHSRHALSVPSAATYRTVGNERSQPAKPATVPAHSQHRRRQDCGGSTPLPLPLAHLTAQPDIQPPTRPARLDVRSRGLALILTGQTGCLRHHRRVTVAAHTASRGDHRDPLQLLIRAPRGCPDCLDRHTQRSRCQLDSAAAHRHDHDHPPLKRAERSHEVGRPSHLLAQLDHIERLHAGRYPRCDQLEVHTLTRTHPQ
jgi:hypothetical protein